MEHRSSGTCLWCWRALCRSINLAFVSVNLPNCPDELLIECLNGKDCWEYIPSKQMAGVGDKRKQHCGPFIFVDAISVLYPICCQIELFPVIWLTISTMKLMIPNSKKNHHVSCQYWVIAVILLHWSLSYSEYCVL